MELGLKLTQEMKKLVIIGDKEVENNQISVRLRNGDDLGNMSTSDFIKKLDQDIINKK